MKLFIFRTWHGEDGKLIVVRAKDAAHANALVVSQGACSTPIDEIEELSTKGSAGIIFTKYLE